MATYLGAGDISDALVAATKLPNSFRRLLGEGALSSVFIPIFSKISVSDGNKKAVEFANNVFFNLLAFLLILFTVFEIFMPFFVDLMSPGFKSIPSKFNLTVSLSRINFIFLVTISLTAMCGGILNSIGKFGYFAAIPIVQNIIIIISVVIMRNSKDFYIARGISYASIISGFCQLILIMHSCSKNGMKIRLIRPRIDENVKLFLKKMFPGLIGSGVYQINIFIDTIFASMFVGGVSYLYYVDRISQIPITLIGGTLSVVLLPTISKHIKLNQRSEYLEIQQNCILFALFASILCISSVVALNKEIIKFVYERGKFTNQDTEVVSVMLLFFSIGFPFSIVSKIYTSYLFAHGDTKSPMKIGFYCMSINTIVNLFTYKHIGYYCVVAGTLSSSFFGAIFPYFYLKKYNSFLITFGLLKNIFKFILIGCLSCLFQKYLNLLFVSYFGFNENISLLIVLFFGVLFYLLITIASKIYTINQVFAFVSVKK